MSLSNGRQVGSRLKDIRKDHVFRYQHAARYLPAGCNILDCACGVGYGSWVLAEAGHRVWGIDIDAVAIRYAEQHWQRPRIIFKTGDALTADLPKVDVVVCFETIEHVVEPAKLLARFVEAAPCLMASVPNEALIPWTDANKFHVRHYTTEQFEDLLTQSGWLPRRWWTQAKKNGPIRDGSDDATLIVMADRA